MLFNDEQLSTTHCYMWLALQNATEIVGFDKVEK